MALVHKTFFFCFIFFYFNFIIFFFIFLGLVLNFFFFFFFFLPRYEDLAMSTKVFRVCMILSFTKLNKILLV